MTRWTAALISTAIAACNAGAPAAEAPSVNVPPPTPVEDAKNHAGAEVKPSTMAPLPIGKAACVVHQGAVVCSKPWLSIPEPAAGLAIGDGHGCIVAASGALYCWGSTEGDRTPTRVPGLEKIVDVALELFPPVCAIDAEGRLFCWGTVNEVPTHIPTPAPALDVASCEEGPCLTLEGGALAVVDAHNPGSGAVMSAFVIPRSRGFASPAFAWQSVPDGARLACGIQSERVACAGDALSTYRPDLLALGSATSLSANKYDACIVTPEERVRCLAAGGPIDIEGVEGAVEVVVRRTGDWACARLKDGAVRCFDTVAGPQQLHDPVAAGG